MDWFNVHVKSNSSNEEQVHRRASKFMQIFYKNAKYSMSEAITDGAATYASLLFLEGIRVILRAQFFFFCDPLTRTSKTVLPVIHVFSFALAVGKLLVEQQSPSFLPHNSMPPMATTAVAHRLSNFAKVWSPETRWALTGWTAFIAENYILSEYRKEIMEYFSIQDDRTYFNIYGICSTAAVGSIGYAYFYKLGKASTANLGMFRIGLAGVLTSAGMVLASQMGPRVQKPVAFNDSGKLELKCPFDFVEHRQLKVDRLVRERTGVVQPGNACPVVAKAGSSSACPVRSGKQQPTTSSSPPLDSTARLPVGTEQITRHPALWSLALVSAGTACLATTVARAVWWMGPTAVAWIGGNHIDSRKRRRRQGVTATTTIASWDPYFSDITSNLPLAVYVTGKVPWSKLDFWKDEKQFKLSNALVATGTALLYVGTMVVLRRRGGR